MGKIFTSPTLSWVAEDRRPEVLIPLTRRDRAFQLADQSGLTQMLMSRPGMSSGGKTMGDVHINVTTRASNPRHAARAVAAEFARATGW
jgi:hypothetical protein